MRNKIFELFKYGICGAVTTVGNLFLFIVLEECGIHYIIANTFSYLAAVLMNYMLNRKYVFKIRQGSAKEILIEFVQFIFVRLLSLAADNIFFYLFVELCALNVYVVRVSLSFVSIMATFFINKMYVFKGSSKNR